MPRPVRSGRTHPRHDHVAAAGRRATRCIGSPARGRRRERQTAVARCIRAAFLRRSRRHPQDRGIRAPSSADGRSRRSGRKRRRAVRHDPAVRSGVQREARAVRASRDRPVSRPHGPDRAAGRAWRCRHGGARPRQPSAGTAALPAASAVQTRARRRGHLYPGAARVAVRLSGRRRRRPVHRDRRAGRRLSRGRHRAVFPRARHRQAADAR